MTSAKDWECANVRVAVFGSAELPFKRVLHFVSTDVAAIVMEIRKHADLPYVFVFTTDREKLIPPLLSALRAVQSPCYPYALFVPGAAESDAAGLGLDIIRTDGLAGGQLAARIAAYARSRFAFDPSALKVESGGRMPPKVDVAIVGAGIVGLYAAKRLRDEGLSVCVVERRDRVGGIWSQYANTTSQVNTSEGAYRIFDRKVRPNRDHSTTREILEDIVQLARHVSDALFLNTTVEKITRGGDAYRIEMTAQQGPAVLESRGVILAVNDRVGAPRAATWHQQDRFKGALVAGIGDDARGVDWAGKRVVIVGMGAFAVENARTALERGARRVTVVCRRHGTVCPKIIDYLNFATPYDADFRHDRKSNMRNMMLWKKLYHLSGATEPECWMGKIKHAGHTISVSDLWFIGHYLKKIETLAGEITGMQADGVMVNDGKRIDADVVVNCIGFHRNAPVAKAICGYGEMFNNNYVDKDFMYLADAYLDDDVFNSFFGSSVLEMVKFYLEVFIRYFSHPGFDTMMRTDGIERIPIEDRSWSHYIAGANALIRNHPPLREIAAGQVRRRTGNFLETHDIEAYIRANKREWMEAHCLLAGRPMTEDECLPYVFEKLIEKKAP